MKKYPELEKLEEASHASRFQEEFLDWLINERELHLCIATEYGFYPSLASIKDLLAEYHKIDLNKVEKERRQLLEDFKNETV